MDFQFLDHLSFEEYQIQLKLQEPVRFHYYHGPVLHGLLCRALNRHPLGPEIALYPAESGRIEYRTSDSYNFGLALFGDCPKLAGQIRSGLEQVGKSPPVGKTVGAFAVTQFARQDEIQPLPKLPEDITLQFITPLRVERRQPLKGKRFFDPAFFDLQRFLRLLHDRVYDLCKLSGTALPPYQVPDIPEVQVHQKSLIWIDTPYHGERKTIGGVVGFVRFKGDLPDHWKRLLWLGQRVHVGRNSAFGFGRYMLTDSQRSLHLQRAQTMLELSTAPSNMMEAFHHVKLNQGTAGSDGESIEAFERDLLRNLEALTTSVREGRYRSQPLTGIIRPKSSGKIRALAIPSVRDRILQRAVTQVLGPCWDLLMEESSFAYRKGLSRVGAAKAIQNAYNDGFRYILESDIESFFDNVDWDLMEDKLRALLISDSIVDIIVGWMKEDVIFRGQRIKRDRGLPQGAAVSPLLANVYLDQFDESLQDDFRLVRYSDDFVVLCKSKERAEEALERTRQALASLELKIKPAKTRIVNFERGFQYLGYIFCRSVVVESEKKKETEKPLAEHLTADDIPHNSWLTHVDISRTKEITRPPSLISAPLAADRDLQVDERFPVYLVDPDIFVRLSGQSLVLTYRNRPHTEDAKIPFNKILAVIDYGKPSITLHAVAKLSQAGIPTYFQNRTGQTYLAVPPRLPNYTVWLKQVQRQKNLQAASRFARAVVCAKIHNHRVLAVRRQWDATVTKKLKELEDKCAQIEEIEAIRGYEGRAAAVYFQHFAAAVSPKWSFHGRMKHPAGDPVNAMLSFGYTCLYHHLATALQICGLNPTIGWYHESRADYFALACDLQEEFRFLVDGLVLYLVNRNMVTPEDFHHDDNARIPVLMTTRFRKSFLAHMEERLMTEFKPDANSETAISYRRFFLRQARQVLSLCTDARRNYKPLRIR